MLRPVFISRFALCAALAVAAIAAAPARAQQAPIKIGLVLPLTGTLSTTGKQVETGVRLYMAQHGDTVAGRKIEIILRDDGTIPENSRRHTQELVANEKVTVLAGFGFTPGALAAAPAVTQSKTPSVIMVAATTSVLDTSPYFVRTSFTMPQVSWGAAEWAPKNGIKRVVTLVSDYGPGIDAETSFIERFKERGGEILETLRVPFRNPDFAPFLQRVRDAKPDAVFVFLPAGIGTQMMKQFAERGLDKAGIRMIGTGDITEDDILPEIGDVALGIVTAHHYSAAHDSEFNKKFTADYSKMFNKRANYMAVHGYDGMHVIYQALKATNGEGGEALLKAMSGISFESPRGPITIEASNRDITQNVYLRKVEKRDGELWNIEFDVIKSVRSPSGKQ